MITDPKLPPAVVLGLSPTGLHVSRTLNRLGVQVIGIGRPCEVGLSSSVFSHLILDQGDANPLDAAETYIGTQQAVLMPTSDEYVELVSKASHKSMLRQQSYLSGKAELLLTKADFYEACSNQGLCHPRTVVLGRHRTPDDLTSLNLPLMIKPSRIHDHKKHLRGLKGWIVAQETDLKKLWPKIAAFQGDLVVQEFVPGPESEIRLVSGSIRANGDVTSLFTARKLRQYPRGIGSASIVQSADEPEAAEMSVRFLRNIGYEGIFGAELKRHPKTGELHFIEINPRTSLWFSVSEAAGCPVVQQAYRDVACPEKSPLATTQVQGVRWRYWSKDSASQIGYALRPNLAFPKPDMSHAGHVTDKVWAVYEPHDMWPAFSEPFSLLRKAALRTLRRSGRK